MRANKNDRLSNKQSVSPIPHQHCNINDRLVEILYELVYGSLVYKDEFESHIEFLKTYTETLQISEQRAPTRFFISSNKIQSTASDENEDRSLPSDGISKYKMKYFKGSTFIISNLEINPENVEKSVEIKCFLKNVISKIYVFTELRKHVKLEMFVNLMSKIELQEYGSVLLDMHQRSNYMFIVQNGCLVARSQSEKDENEVGHRYVKSQYFGDINFVYKVPLKYHQFECGNEGNCILFALSHDAFCNVIYPELSNKR
ncbi:hypothetical protein GJ496_002372 [Pomphorhynchus laevis]|nr:hypothetical protein GJ496_002372 [Pomphorhynchus laevis]